MAAVMKMEPVQNGVRSTNHDRNLKLNGVDGGGMVKPDPDGKYFADGAANMDAVQQIQTPAQSLPADNPSRMNDLPDEIQHITENFLSISQLLSRLAQKSHNELQEKIIELAKKPLPIAPTLNGHTDHSNIDDASVENLDKKVLLLRFAQEQHAKWVKALVITEWSKKAALVSKLIDLKGHLQQQMMTYDLALDSMMTCKRNLAYARLPSPDLKTALQVLTTGNAPWLPDFGYIEPPPLTAKDQLKWLDDINTLLSLRLTIGDHEKIPYHFRSYKISSGRVTFTVEGEFEVDLTIADEDVEKQFWFIDFRYLFAPSPAELSETFRLHLEVKVNDILASEGLAGCYKYLHELVLTHKVSELRRQALQLGRSRWVDTLKIEPLNRSLAIQYWTSRYPPNAPKNWIIIGVHSGAPPPGAQPHPKFKSYVSLRWFRNNLEIKGANVPLNLVSISTETVLKAVIARHVEQILTAIHAKLLEKPRFAKREASLGLHISKMEPTESRLTMQFTHLDTVTVRIDPITGLYALEPRLRLIPAGENSLNMFGKDPVVELERLRNIHALEELMRRGKSLGWQPIVRSPVKMEDLRSILTNREATDALGWFKRQGWNPQFFLLVSLSLSGDRWWLVELGANHPTGARIRSHVPLPFTPGQPNLGDPFFSDLTVFVTAIITQLTDVRELRSRRIRHMTRHIPSPNMPPRLKLPTILIRLSEILPSARAQLVDAGVEGGRTERRGRPWAAESVRLLVTGVQPASSDELASRGMFRAGASTRNDPYICVTASASVVVLDKSKFRLLSSKVDHDVSFSHRTGEFSLRIRAGFGESMISSLASRLQAIERLVEFLDSIGRNRQGVECESITLRKVVFTYADPSPPTPPVHSEAGASLVKPEAPVRRWKVWLDLRKPKSVKVALEPDNPHMRVLDMLQTLVNGEKGLESLPFWLPMTLSAVRGMEAVDESWQQLQISRRGMLEIFNKTLDWTTLRYTLSSSPARRLNLDVRLRQRRGEAWWHICRSDRRAAPEGDEFDKALKKVWEGKGVNWKGLSRAAAGRPAAGIEELLQVVDKAVRTVLEQPLPAAPAQQLQHQQSMAHHPPPAGSLGQTPQQIKAQQMQAQQAKAQQIQAQLQAQAKAKAQGMVGQGLANHANGSRPPHVQRPGGQVRQTRPAPQAPKGNNDVVDLT
ncbi:hypothetical protein RB598_004578 [Gaeumannomyces tritici]